MAISRKRKEEVITQYLEWIHQSRGMILAEYQGLSMKDLDALRSKVREIGGEFHVIKNTLGKLAFESAGLAYPGDVFLGSTAIGFAFEDAPAMAKTLNDFARTSEALKLKSGYLGKVAISAEQIKSLAELPPLPVMRSQLMGTILAPASKLVRTLAEPARQVAAVLQAYAEKDGGAIAPAV